MCVCVSCMCVCVWARYVVIACVCVCNGTRGHMTYPIHDAGGHSDGFAPSFLGQQRRGHYSKRAQSTCVVLYVRMRLLFLFVCMCGFVLCTHSLCCVRPTFPHSALIAVVRVVARVCVGVTHTHTHAFNKHAGKHVCLCVCVCVEIDVCVSVGYVGCDVGDSQPLPA